MKTKNTAFLLFTGFTLAFFMACDFQRTISVEAGETIAIGEGQTRYFSLYPEFQEITETDEIYSDAWDIAIFSRVGNRRAILTNSGNTAAALNYPYGSGGQGAVWHTERFNITGVSLGDKVTDWQDNRLKTDTTLYFESAMTGETERRIFNVMNYPGWESGDGLTPETRFREALHNAKQFHGPMGPGMPPVFDPTGRVYIVRHGCGTRYSAVQVFGYRSGPPEFYVLKVRNF